MKKKKRLNLPRMILTVFILASMVIVGVSVNNIFSLRAEQKELKSVNKQLLAEKS